MANFELNRLWQSPDVTRVVVTVTVPAPLILKENVEVAGLVLHEQITVRI